MGPKPEIAAQQRKILAACEKQQPPVDEHPLRNYDEHNPFVLCARTYTPIYRGRPSVRCSLCTANYTPEARGQVCTVCTVAEVGRECVGLRISPIQFK